MLAQKEILSYLLHKNILENIFTYMLLPFTNSVKPLCILYLHLFAIKFTFAFGCVTFYSSCMLNEQRSVKK